MDEELELTEYNKSIINCYNGFLDNTVDRLTTLFANSNMTGEQQTEVVSNVFNSAMGASVNAKQIEDASKLIAEQIKTEQKKQANYIADIKIKVQQELAEQIKNGGLHFTYTQDADGNIVKTLNNGTGKSIYEAQIELEQAQIDATNKKIDLDEQIANMDIGIKEQQELAEKLKNGGLNYEYTYDEQGNITDKILKNGTTKSIYEVEKEKEYADMEHKKKLGITETIKQKRQYGATENNGTISYETDGKSVVEKQIDGFDKSNYKELTKNFQQAIGLIYNSGEKVPDWYMDTLKKATELLTDKKIDFQQSTTDGVSTTNMSSETTWTS